MRLAISSLSLELIALAATIAPNKLLHPESIFSEPVIQVAIKTVGRAAPTGSARRYTVFIKRIDSYGPR